LGISGLTVAVWMALEPAPDVALVQITVDLLATVILVLCLARLPRAQREKAQEFTFRQSRPGLVRDAVIALASGMVVAIMVFAALSSKPRISQVSPYFQINAKPLTGARDIVGAILVDFRGFDTLVEITVFASAGIGLYMLLHYAARKAGDREDPDPAFIPEEHPTTGIVGPVTSPLLRLLAYSLLPLVLVLGIIQVLYGHDQPGDGFTAGVFIALAIDLYYIVFGYHSTKLQLPWLKPALLIAGGILLVLINGLLGTVLGTGFMSPVNYGQLIGLPLPQGFYLSNSFIFELAICLVVLGSAVYIVDNLGRPKEQDIESDALLTVLDQEQT
jgi:multicomponent K+:H+ antiporter subunit A